MKQDYKDKMSTGNAEVLERDVMKRIGLLIRPVRVSDYGKIRDFLLETKSLYPGIGYWWDNRVCSSMASGKRIVYVVDVDGCIEGLFIGKRGVSAKICTLRLRKSIRGQGVGSDLLSVGISHLIDPNTNQLYVTVSGAAEDGSRHFFESEGFKLKAVEPNRYNKGVEEFVYVREVERIE